MWIGNNSPLFSCNFGLQPLFGKADAEGNPMHKKTKYRLLFSKSNRKRFRTSERIRKWLSFVWQCQARPTLCRAGEEFPTPGENAARRKGNCAKTQGILKKKLSYPRLMGEKTKTPKSIQTRPNTSKRIRTHPNTSEHLFNFAGSTNRVDLDRIASDRARHGRKF